MGCGASKVARGAVARAARTIGGQPGINNRDHRGVGYREIWIVSGEPSEGSIRRFRRVPQMGGVGGLDVQRPGFFEGQRPGIIPAYGTTIGIGRRNGERAEGPGTFRGFVAGNDGSGLQPLDLSFAVPDLGLHPISANLFRGAVGCIFRVVIFAAGLTPTNPRRFLSSSC